MFVFTDGAASDNGYPTCKAGWGVFFAPDDPRNDCGPILIGPSNQKAELYAIKMALEKTRDISHVTIVTDSKYSVDCLTKWCKSWEKNGWKTGKGEPVKHSTLIKECREMLEKSSVDFKHVNSHLIPPKDKTSLEWQLWFGNDNADKLASKGSSMTPKTDGRGSFKGKVVTFDEEGNIVATEEKKKDLKITKDPKAPKAPKAPRVPRAGKVAKPYLVIDL
jgi:ribonuclease HI